MFKHFLDSWAEICQIFWCFYRKFKKSKRHSEINWPLHKSYKFKPMIVECMYIKDLFETNLKNCIWRYENVSKFEFKAQIWSLYIRKFVLHIFELHRYAWFQIRMCSIFGSEKAIFCKNCMIQKTREKVLLQIFWWIEIVSMDPKSNVILSGDIFEYSYNLIE